MTYTQRDQESAQYIGNKVVDETENAAVEKHRVVDEGRVTVGGKQGETALTSPQRKPRPTEQKSSTLCVASNALTAFRKRPS